MPSSLRIENHHNEKIIALLSLSLFLVPKKRNGDQSFPLQSPGDAEDGSRSFRQHPHPVPTIPLSPSIQEYLQEQQKQKHPWKHYFSFEEKEKGATSEQRAQRLLCLQSRALHVCGQTEFIVRAAALRRSRHK